MIDLKKFEHALRPLSDEEIEGALDNIEKCLEAERTGGQAALDRELDRIFPGTSAKPHRAPDWKDLGNGLVSETLPGGNGRIEMHVTRRKRPGE